MVWIVFLPLGLWRSLIQHHNEAVREAVARPLPLSPAHPGADQRIRSPSERPHSAQSRSTRGCCSR
jgi:hypothetical protein